MIAFANTLWYNSSTKKEEGIAMANTLVQFRADETTRIKAVGISENRGMAAMKEASRIAAAEGIADMTLDEINEEIAETRKLS